jgi:hypothetical protein
MPYWAISRQLTLLPVGAPADIGVAGVSRLPSASVPVVITLPLPLLPAWPPRRTTLIPTASALANLVPTACPAPNKEKPFL